jgi:TetR/AcrR family transcriptional regulator
MVKLSSSSKKSKPVRKPRPGRGANIRPALSAPEGGDTERRILAAARAEFIAKGLAGARMQIIASEAGVNKALLHYYYRSKEKLYQTALKDILQSVWSLMRREFLAQGPGKDLESLVHTFVSTYTRTLAANPDFPLFLFREVASGGEALQPVAKEMFQEFGEVPAALIRALQAEIKAGKIRPIAPVHFFMNMAGMCVVTFLAMPILRRLEPAMGVKFALDQDFLAERIEAITAMIFHGLRNKR